MWIYLYIKFWKNNSNRNYRIQKSANKSRLETGYSPYAERTVISKIEELEQTLKNPAQIAFMHRIDNILFSHGGLTTDFVRWLNEELLDAGIDDVVTAVNDAPQDYLWNDASPLWLRPQYKNVDVFSTYRGGRQIGESAMIVMDSNTGKYEKIEVPGKLKYKVFTETVIESAE